MPWLGFWRACSAPIGPFWPQFWPRRNRTGYTNVGIMSILYIWSLISDNGCSSPLIPSLNRGNRHFHIHFNFLCNFCLRYNNFRIMSILKLKSALRYQLPFGPIFCPEWHFLYNFFPLETPIFLTYYYARYRSHFCPLNGKSHHKKSFGHLKVSYFSA